MQPAPQLLNVKQVATMLNISQSGVWAKAAHQEDFPKPFKLSARETRWSVQEINSWILDRMAVRGMVAN